MRRPDLSILVPHANENMELNSDEISALSAPSLLKIDTPMPMSAQELVNLTVLRALEPVMALVVSLRDRVEELQLQLDNVQITTSIKDVPRVRSTARQRQAGWIPGSRRPTMCFICSQVGHKAMCCPQKPTVGGPCLICDMSGHTVVTCERRCGRCGTAGHSLRSCPKRRASQQPR